MSSTTFKILTDHVFDSVYGYQKAIEKAQRPELKAVLNRQLEARGEVLSKMNAQLERNGDPLVTKGTMAGDLHRAWMSVVDLFENDDEAAAERVEEGEDYLKKQFESALEQNDLSEDERTIIQECYHNVKTGETFGDMLEKQYD